MKPLLKMDASNGVAEDRLLAHLSQRFAMKPLLKMDASNGVAEDRLLAHLSQHFEPAEVGASLIVAIQAVKKGAAADGMTVRDYVWCGHVPTSVAVTTEDVPPI